MPAISIRLRITLFGLGVVSAVLGLFCVAVYVLLAAGVANTQDEALAARAEQAAAGLSGPLPPRATGPAPGAIDPRLSTDVFVLVVDSTGAVLHSTGTIDGRLPSVPAGTLAAPRSTVDLGGGPVRVHVRPVEGGYVIAAQTTRRVQDDRRGLFALVVVYAILGFAAAAGAIWLVTGRALRPLRSLTAHVDEIGRTTDLGRRLPAVASRDDVGRLTASFNHMLERLHRTFSAQQRFTADASHELRTPLTTIRNNAGFLLRHPDAAAGDRDAAVRDIAGESERMSRLVDNLLTLARADAGQPLTFGPTDLGELAEQVCRQAAAQHPDRSIHCAVTPAPPVRGDRDALTQLLWILVDNAVKYTAEDGNVWVTVTQHGGLPDGVCQVNVTDDGIGIPAGDERRVFDRFYRSDQARSGGGAGLGLSIAAWIVRAHGGTIVAANNAKGGASFVAGLPFGSSSSSH